MKRLLIILFSFASCAATSRYSYEESPTCPVQMTEEQHASGAVRCRAMCSSYGRDFASFDPDCKCRCAPAQGVYSTPNVTSM